MTHPGQITNAPAYPALHEAALRHLARYAATRAGLLRVLHRRIDRWAREATAAGAEDLTAAKAASREAARSVVDRLATAGVVDDAAFAAQRARSLTRAGRSRRAVAAHLAERGVAGEVTREALPEDAAAELAAAVATARRRRLGPFRPAGGEAEATPDAATLLRELAVLARAGFPQDVARQALQMDHATAEQMVIDLRRG